MYISLSLFFSLSLYICMYHIHTHTERSLSLPLSLSLYICIETPMYSIAVQSGCVANRGSRTCNAILCTFGLIPGQSTGEKRSAGTDYRLRCGLDPVTLCQDYFSIGKKLESAKLHGSSYVQLHRTMCYHRRNINEQT